MGGSVAGHGQSTPRGLRPRVCQRGRKRRNHVPLGLPVGSFTASVGIWSGYFGEEPWNFRSEQFWQMWGLCVELCSLQTIFSINSSLIWRNSLDFYHPYLHSNTAPPPPVMGCGATEATGLGFVCFVVLNSRVLSANRFWALFVSPSIFYHLTVFTPLHSIWHPGHFASSLPKSPGSQFWWYWHAHDINSGQVSWVRFPISSDLIKEQIILSNISYKCDGGDDFGQIL